MNIPPHVKPVLSKLLLLLIAIQFAVLLSAQAVMAGDTPVLPKFTKKVPAGTLVQGATAYGAMLADVPVVPVLKGETVLGYAYVTSDFVSTTGYSGKPIHVLVAMDTEGHLLGADLVKHSEPIVLIGIPNSKIKAMTEAYRGLDIIAEAADRGSAHDLDIISGATVTVMIIDDTILRASIKVAHALEIGGLKNDAGTHGPTHEINMDVRGVMDWGTMAGDGTVRRMTLDIGQINQAFADTGDARALKRPEPGAETDTFIDMQVAVVSSPAIGISLLGENEYENLVNRMEDGDSAILVLGRGIYSFKGSGYVRGGIFDRIMVIQGDNSVRFRDRQHKRLGHLAAEGAPEFTELDMFVIPADSEFDPAKPFRVQLLAQRAVGPVEKIFLTYDLGYKIPDRFLTRLPVQETASVQSPTEEDAAARRALWQRAWNNKKVEIAVLFTMLTVLTAVFFFQHHVTRNKRVFYWFRMGFLAVTLVYIGWYQNAQLSIVNLMALTASLKSGFTWDAFLIDPLVFILWVSVAVTLLFWGRGGFCGWLCPFGALQELSNQIARFFKVPQWTLPWGLHERLWPVKYMIFLGLFGLSLVSIPVAEHYAEIEPFKTSIILKFARSWPYVLFATAILGAGLFVERFYCRYLCPLGAALAIPGRLRMFDWLKRYKECGSPCQTCANECFVQSIHPTGEINPNECLSCLHCQVLYQDTEKCPVVIRKLKRRERDAKGTRAEAMDQLLANHPNYKPAKEKTDV
jgi:NosR/NirI family nitrous oxide reductase transcriptional regulator